MNNQFRMSRTPSKRNLKQKLLKLGRGRKRRKPKPQKVPPRKKLRYWRANMRQFWMWKQQQKE